MDDVVARAQALVSEAEEDIRRLIPSGTALVDAHVHVGVDIDGFRASLDDLLAFLGRWGVSRAFCFCLDEPDRHPAFRAANDRTLDAAARSAGVLIPFARLDLAEEPLEEATRSLDRGARGIKLHPRAQGFLFDDNRLAPIFAIAAERRVPILIHGGRGLPRIADDLGRLADRHPDAQLIIAHAGIADLAGLCNVFAGRPGVFFDTSVWSVYDLLDLLGRVPPEQVVFASDYPYGRQPSSLMLAIRAAKRAGLDDDQLRGVLGGNAARIARGEPPPRLTRVVGGERVEQPLVFARIHHYIATAIPLLWSGQAERVGSLGLAINTCHDSNGDAGTRELIEQRLRCGREIWSRVLETEEPDERLLLWRLAFTLLHLADIEALTAT